MNLDQAAYLANLTTVRFHQRIRPLIPSEAVKHHGQKVVIEARAAMKGIIDYRSGQQPGGKDVDENEASTPALEKYRAVRAEMAQMDLEERKATHVPLKALEGALNKFGGLLHRAGEALQRRFGNEASDIYNTGVDDALTEMKKEINRVSRVGRP